MCWRAAPDCAWRPEIERRSGGGLGSMPSPSCGRSMARRRPHSSGPGANACSYPTHTRCGRCGRYVKRWGCALPWPWKCATAQRAVQQPWQPWRMRQRQRADKREFVASDHPDSERVPIAFASASSKDSNPYLEYSVPQLPLPLQLLPLHPANPSESHLYFFSVRPHLQSRR